MEPRMDKAFIKSRHPFGRYKWMNGKKTSTLAVLVAVGVGPLLVVGARTAHGEAEGKDVGSSCEFVNNSIAGQPIRFLGLRLQARKHLVLPMG